MSSPAKLLLLMGSLLIVSGLLWQLLGGLLPFGRLPGDIVYEKGNLRFYFPLATCLLLSIAISALAYLLRLFK